MPSKRAFVPDTHSITTKNCFYQGQQWFSFLDWAACDQPITASSVKDCPPLAFRTPTLCSPPTPKTALLWTLLVWSLFFFRYSHSLVDGISWLVICWQLPNLCLQPIFSNLEKNIPNSSLTISFCLVKKSQSYYIQNWLPDLTSKPALSKLSSSQLGSLHPSGGSSPKPCSHPRFLSLTPLIGSIHQQILLALPLKYIQNWPLLTFLPPPPCWSKPMVPLAWITAAVYRLVSYILPCPPLFMLWKAATEWYC